jgi:hypothetical protein
MHSKIGAASTTSADLFTKHGREASEGAEDAVFSNESEDAGDHVLFCPALVSHHLDAGLFHGALCDRYWMVM